MFRKIVSALGLVGVFTAVAVSSSSAAPTPTTPESARTALAAAAQTSMSAVSALGSSSPIRTVKSLTNGQTVQAFRYHTQSADNVADVWFDTDWLGGAPREAIITVHGGSWHNATRKNSDKAAQKWLDAGFVVMNIDYRLAADHPALPDSGATGTVLGSRWPAQRIDVALAYDWLKANAAQFNVDPNSVGLYGFSAGGHIANVAAGYYGTTRFKASASISGIQQPHRLADIAMNSTWGSDSVSPTIVKVFGYETSLIGCSYEPTWSDCGGKWNSIKPETYFGADKPALYAIKGDVDPAEPITSLTATEYWLDKAGQDHLTVAVPGRGHDEYLVLGTGTDDVARWNQLVTWMRSKL
jgi:dienelactone hydrolase